VTQIRRDALPVRARAAPGALVAVLAGLLVTGCASAAGTAAPAQPAASPSRSLAAATASPARTPPPSPRPGTFPTLVPVPPSDATMAQTRARPRASTAVFRAEMTDLWAAVTSGRIAFGLRSFFPLGAYRQVKAIADPAADWHNRLVADFSLDVTAAHHFLGRSAHSARLVRVIVPDAEASWINPGVCYNSVGYWHAAGARIVYRLRHQLRSIGIASLISWRGRWYVVHFGAVLRNSAAGVVDQPAQGTGATGPPGGC
jgi:hypothetical protein